MDLTKLSPAPWRKCQASEGKCRCKMVWSTTADVPVMAALTSEDETYTCGEGVNEESAQANGDFIALARNAFDFWYKRDPDAAMKWLTDTEKWYNEQARTGAVNT